MKKLILSTLALIVFGSVFVGCGTEYKHPRHQGSVDTPIYVG